MPEQTNLPIIKKAVQVLRAMNYTKLLSRKIS